MIIFLSNIIFVPNLEELTMNESGADEAEAKEKKQPISNSSI